MADLDDAKLWLEYEDAATAEAERRIAEAIETRADTLDFSDLAAMKVVPTEIAEVETLAHLYLGERNAAGVILPHSNSVEDFTALTELTSIRTLDLSYLVGRDASFLVDFKSLTSLALSHTRVDDVSGLSGLVGLTSLDLSDTRVDDVSGLSGLVGLTSLDLSDTGVTDVSGLSGLVGLTSLDLSDTGVTDVSGLSGLVGLTSLDLSDTGVDDVSGLSGLVGLTSLDLRDTRVDDVSALSGLTALTSLHLGRTRLSDASALSGLTALTSLDLSGTGLSDASALSGLTALTSLDLSNTSLSDASVLSGLTALTSLNLRETRLSDLSFLLEMIAFENERGRSLYFANTPVASPDGDRRLYMLSRLDPQSCAIETVQYLKGTHPDFREPPEPFAVLVQRQLSKAGAIEVDASGEKLEARNAGAPERLAPRELEQRIAALRYHVAALCTEANSKQLPETMRKRFDDYAVPLTAEEPTYLLLDGPMSFLRGGASDPYITDGMDGGFVAAWQQLVVMHDDLRPFLLPPEENDPELPEVTEDATPEAGIEIVDDAIEALEADDSKDVVDQSVIDAMNATRDYFEAAKTDDRNRSGLLKRGFKTAGGIFAGILGVGGSAAGIASWAATPQGQAIISKLQPLFEMIVKFFGG